MEDVKLKKMQHFTFQVFGNIMYVLLYNFFSTIFGIVNNANSRSPKIKQ